MPKPVVTTDERDVIDRELDAALASFAKGLKHLEAAVEARVREREEGDDA